MSGKVPPSSRARTRAPISANSEIKKAARLYERFTGHEAEGIGRIKVKPLPRVAVAVGIVDGILYTTVRDGVEEKYIHKFAVADKPVFAVTPDGKQILFLGGSYDFTERGIVDRSDKKNRRR